MAVDQSRYQGRIVRYEFLRYILTRGRGRIDFIFLSEATGRPSSTLNPALIPRKGISQTIQNCLQAPFPTKRLAVCNISRRRKGDGIADMILLGSVKYSFKLGGITGENHNLFHLGLRALRLILNCLKLTLPVFMMIKASPGAGDPKRALGYML